MNKGRVLLPKVWLEQMVSLRCVLPQVDRGRQSLVTAIADAKLDSIPLVCITGQSLFSHDWD